METRVEEWHIGADVSGLRIAKVAGVVAGGLVALVATAVLGASVVLQGPRLGALIEGALPENRGKLQIAGVGWSLRALTDIVTDVPSPISVDGLKIIDPEGTVVLDVPHLDAKIKLATLIKGSFSIHDLKVGKATWRFAQMKDSEGIGFLAALESKKPATPPPAPKKDDKPQGPGSFFHIVNAELDDLNAIFDFPGAWGLELRHARTTASLIQSAVDPAHPVFGFDAGPIVAEGGGWLRILDDNLLPFDKVVINRVSTTQDRPDDIFLDLREAKTGKSTLVGKGYFTGIYGATSVPGIDLHTEFHDAADAFNQVIAGKKIDGLSLTGDATATIDLKEPFAELKVKARFDGLNVNYAPGPYRLDGIGFDLGFDGGAMQITLRDFVAKAPGGGTLGLGVALDAKKMRLAADLTLNEFTTDSFLPPAIQPLGGGTVTGRLHADADLSPVGQSVAISRLALRMDRRRAAGLPKTIRVHGDALLSAARVKTSGLVVEIPGATARAAGEVKLARQTVALAVDLLASDLARVLDSMGLPPLGKTARVTARLDGPLTSPTASGTLLATGLSFGKRMVPELRARFGLEAGVARLDDLSGGLFGGRLEAHGSVRLYEKSTKHMLKQPVVDLQLSARDIDLGAAAGADVVAGRVSLEAEVKGPVNALTGTVRIPGRHALMVAGESLLVGPVELALNGADQAVTIQRLTISRKAGGTLDVTGTAAVNGPLSLDVVLAAVPLAGLPGVADAGVGLMGTVAATLHIGGTQDRPEISGAIKLTAVTARGVRLGDGTIEIRPDDAARVGAAPVVAIAMKGNLFDRFTIDGRFAQSFATNAPGPAIHGTLEFNRLALEALLPELSALGDGRGLASGRVTVDLEPGRPLAAEVWLNELWVSLARAIEASPGEASTRRVEIRASKAVHIAVQGDRVALDSLHLTTTGGDLRAQGTLAGTKLDGTVEGHVDLELLQPFVRGFVDRVSGDLDVGLVASGTVDKPILRGTLNVRDPIRIRPKTFESDVIIPSGEIALEPGLASVRKLGITVDGSTTQLDGRVMLGADFTPQSIDAHLAGEISARLLSYLAGESISEAQGRARIKADVRGKLTDPTVTAWLGLGTITFRLRDLGTQVEVQSGVVELSNKGALLRDVRVVLDDQGKLIIGAAGVRPGQMEIRRLVPFELGRVDFPLHGEQLTYRSPGSFEINDLAFDLDLSGDLDEGFGLAGEVRIIAGRYVQDFKLSNLVLSPRVNESAVRPFYAGKPLLENMPLDLTVRTVGDAFVVQNNIAPEIHIDIALRIGGTLSQPTIAGDVRPTDGRFRIPGLRGDFDLVPNVNHVTFVETKAVADGDTPDIRIEAQNPIIDAAGVEHIVRMFIHGPVREMQIDLSTSGGLDRNQTAFLLLTGRTSSANDRLTTQNPTVGANFNTGLDIAGQATRDTIANLMEPIIGDTFERAVGAQLRLTVGPDGFEGRLTKRISRYTKFQAEALMGFQGTSRQTLQMDQWLLDYISTSFSGQRLVLPQQPGLTENAPLNWNLELRWDFPIRR